MFISNYYCIFIISKLQYHYISASPIILYNCSPLLMTLVSRIWVVLDKWKSTWLWNRFDLIFSAFWRGIFEGEGFYSLFGLVLIHSSARSFISSDCRELAPAILMFRISSGLFCCSLDHFRHLPSLSLLSRYLEWLSFCLRWWCCHFRLSFTSDCRRNLFSKCWSLYLILL